MWIGCLLPLLNLRLHAVGSQIKKILSQEFKKQSLLTKRILGDFCIEKLDFSHLFFFLFWMEHCLKCLFQTYIYLYFIFVLLLPFQRDQKRISLEKKRYNLLFFISELVNKISFEVFSQNWFYYQSKLYFPYAFEFANNFK